MIPSATPEEVGLSAAGLSRIDALLQDHLAAPRAPGIVTLVARHSKVAHIACAGAMSLERDQAVTPATLFRIYSMTKPITCVALLMLVEAGRIGLDDPVARYLPAFAAMQVLAAGGAGAHELLPLARPLTVRDLLTHTAGLGYGLFADSPVEYQYRAARLLSRVLTLRPPLAELAARVAELPLANQPGTAWRYSFAHDVVAQIVALVADQPFADVLRERIFMPLGMVNTSFSVSAAQQEHFATLYLRDQVGGLRLIDDPATSLYLSPGVEPAGGGGLVATVGDYLRFAQLLLNQGQLDGVRLLAPKTVALMTQNQLTADLLPFSIGPDWPWEGYGYGLGVAVLQNPAQAGLPGAAGTFEWPGAAGTMFWVDPRNELIGLLMTQLLPAPLSPPIDHSFRRLVYASLIT